MSNKAKHTPGPWMHEGQLNPAGADLVIVNADYAVICDCRESNGRQGHYPEAEEAEANAKLIATATDLLEACRFALEAMSCTCNPSKEAPALHCDCITCDAANKLTAAIAKATQPND